MRPPVSAVPSLSAVTPRGSLPARSLTFDSHLRRRFRASSSGSASARIPGARSASDALKTTARDAAGDYIRDYGQALDRLERRAGEMQRTVGKIRDEVDEAGKDAAHAVKEASVKASQGISRAGEDAAEEIKRQSMRSSVIIALLSVFGGILAGIGAFCLFQVSKPLQSFVRANGGFSLVLILLGVAFAAYIIVCVVLGRKKKR